MILDHSQKMIQKYGINIPEPVEDTLWLERGFDIAYIISFDLTVREDDDENTY
jgi:hypothetical protein